MSDHTTKLDAQARYDILSGVLSTSGMNRYLNGDPIPLAADGIGAIIDATWNRKQATLSQAAPDVATDIEDLLADYWNIAFAEGVNGVSLGDEAQIVLSKIRAALASRDKDAERLDWLIETYPEVLRLELHSGSLPIKDAIDAARAKERG